MFASLLRLLESPTPLRPPNAKLSVAVLLLEAARQDDRFDSRERAAIEKILSGRFHLSGQECADLIEAAEKHAHNMVQLHGHTDGIAQEMTPRERVDLIEMLWEVAYADGVLDPEEDHLIRRIGKLIHVEDRERVHARQRVLARMKQQGIDII
ncbi:MAG TPA: TerB family tellurite resistance protein [Rhizomicrobium sp.]|nr:TerB family tellurite resistance protein [Rhizomicrobium sp.]